MTNSLINELYGHAKQREPQVGDGATVLMWTDRHAATIVEVSASGRGILIQEDTAIRMDGNGMSDAQRYHYERNTDAPRVSYTLRKNGAWVRKGEPMKGGRRLLVGKRDHHYDFSF